MISTTQLSGNDGGDSPARGQAFSPNQTGTAEPQTLTLAPLTTVYELPASPKREIITYSKGVQTSDLWPPQRQENGLEGASDEERSISPSPSRTRKRLSRRERERDEELKQRIRQEIEEELKALQLSDEKERQDGKENYPARPLTHEELNAVTGSEDFLEFVERSSKVIERALEEEYDVLADYALSGFNGLDEDDEESGAARGRKGRRVKEVCQFQDEHWTKRRMVTDLDFSMKVGILFQP